MAEDPRLHRLTTICLDLPGATREVMASHAAFSVKKRKFAYFLDNHHGDGIVALCFRGGPGEAEDLRAAQDELSGGELFFSPAYIGPRGWIGMRLDLGDVDWSRVAGLVAASYRRVAS